MSSRPASGSVFSQVARDLVVGVGRIGARALVRAGQSIAQDAMKGLGDVQANVKRAHDRLEGIVDVRPWNVDTNYRNDAQPTKKPRPEAWNEATNSRS